jgi:hypothetical protein
MNSVAISLVASFASIQDSHPTFVSEECFMKMHCERVVVAIFTFTLGVVLGTVAVKTRPASEASSKTSVDAPPLINCPSSTLKGSEESCFELIDDNDFHPKLNGWEIPLGNEPLSDDEIAGVKVITLSKGRSLVGARDSLTMFDSQKRVIWEFALAGNPLIDFDVVETTGLVYGTAGDNMMFILNLSSGKELKVIGRNGSAAFGEVRAYGKDLCLIKDNFWGYRQKLPDPKFEPMKDGLTAWRGTKLLWQVDFPPDAELIVSGKKIFALTRTKTKVYLKEVFLPR